MIKEEKATLPVSKTPNSQERFFSHSNIKSIKGNWDILVHGNFYRDNHLPEMIKGLFNLEAEG